MVVYLFRWKIKAGLEKQFEENWAVITRALRDQGGSYGSRLHLSNNGEYVGYAQWPSVEVRENCNVSTPELEIARKLMREAIETSYPDMLLEVKSDFLIHGKT